MSEPFIAALCERIRDHSARKAPLAVRGGAPVFSLVLDQRFYFSNLGDPYPDRIEIDLGDGAGFRRVRFGETIVAAYAPGSSPVVSVRCRMAESRSAYSRVSFPLLTS